VAASAALIVLPAFAENAVYPWTKLLTAFFVIAGLVLWGDGVDHVSRPHRLPAAILLAGGLLTHYSAAVYVVAAVLHEVFLLVVAVVRRRAASGIGATLRANILAAAAAVAVCVPWIGWAVVMFGIEGTFATNTAVVDAAVYTPMGNIAKVLLLTGTMVGYAYGMEFFIAWYSGSEYEQFCFINRAFGPYWWAYWIMISCNVISPQFFWVRSLRRNPAFLFVVSIFVNIGMWFERFVITVSSLNRDFLPSSWAYFSPTIIDILTYAGSFGLFFTFFLLFCRFMPIIAISEVKGVMPEANPHHGHDDHSHGHSAAHTH
jgi:hypothetical protein